MPCYHPLQAWRGNVGESGKRSVVFNKPCVGESLVLPCGRCVGCRLERSRVWAVRCLHESEMYEKNCFITLTYDDEHLPKNGSVDVREFQLFMKRFRKRFGKVRFFHCGEYGERLGRPHYHACLFGFDFDDRVLWKVKNGCRYYLSASLLEVWGNGYAVVGDVTFESAAYVARYIMKKVTGDGADAHYAGRHPEYVTMSRRPGIGKPWYDRFKSDAYPGDNVVVRGFKMKPPKYYDGFYDIDDHVGMDLIKSDRILKADKLRRFAFDSKGRCVSHDEKGRLLSREAVKLAQIKSLSRSLESGHEDESVFPV